MPTITNTFYPLIHLQESIPTEEDFYRFVRESSIDVDDMHQDYTLFGLSSLLYRNDAYGHQKWITSNAMDQLEEAVRDFRKFTDLFPRLDNSLKEVHQGSVIVSTEYPAANECELHLLNLLDDYSRLVAASHQAASHGKSWEPLLSIRVKDDQINLSLQSYQAGDDFSAHGTIVEVTEKLSAHVEEVRSILLTGSTNTNPLVMGMIGDNSDEAQDRYQILTEDGSITYRDTLLSNEIFLPSLFPGCTVESSGYPDITYSPARVEYGDAGNTIYPVLHLAVGLTQLY